MVPLKREFDQLVADQYFVPTERRNASGFELNPIVMAALFHGLPGTGKTETALQIARATGRAVFHVDISEVKSCWYGESQKLVKGIFTDYKKLCEEEKRKPILLFNEADALLSSRHNIHNTSRPEGTKSQ